MWSLWPGRLYPVFVLLHSRNADAKRCIKHLAYGRKRREAESTTDQFKAEEKQDGNWERVCIKRRCLKLNWEAKNLKNSKRYINVSSVPTAFPCTFCMLTSFILIMTFAIAALHIRKQRYREFESLARGLRAGQWRSWVSVCDPRVCALNHSKSTDWQGEKIEAVVSTWILALHSLIWQLRY